MMGTALNDPVAYRSSSSQACEFDPIAPSTGATSNRHELNILNQHRPVNKLMTIIDVY